MFKLDMFDVANVLCFAAMVHNEVKNYVDVKFMEKQTRPDWDAIHKIEEYHDRRRNVILAAQLVTAAASIAWKLYSNKK